MFQGHLLDVDAFLQDNTRRKTMMTFLQPSDEIQDLLEYIYPNYRHTHVQY
jgi:hypothetical protein